MKPNAAMANQRAHSQKNHPRKGIKKTHALDSQARLRALEFVRKQQVAA